MNDWKNFMAEAEAESQSRWGSGCGVAAYLDGLTAKNRAEVEKAFARPELTGSSIYKALKGRGATFSAYTLRRHRKGECACPTNGQ